MIPGDTYRGIVYANFIGQNNKDLFFKYGLSKIYWGYVSFALSVLCGIFYVNVNAMLFPYLYYYNSMVIYSSNPAIYKNNVNILVITLMFDSSRNGME